MSPEGKFLLENCFEVRAPGAEPLAVDRSIFPQDAMGVLSAYALQLGIFVCH